MSRPRAKPLAPQVQALLALTGHIDLDTFAQAHNLSPNTVRTWDKRGYVPAPQLSKFADKYGVRAESLRDGLTLRNEPQTNQTNSPATYDPRLGSGGTLLSATAYLAKEGAPPWQTSTSNEMTGVRSRGEGLGPDRRPVTPSALLQTRGAGAVRPLLLSLPLGERGGPNREYELIPKHVRHAAAGKGEVAPAADQLDLVGDMAFSFEWMRDNMAHTTGMLTTIKVRGDSMSKTLLDGDTIMIDEGVVGIDVDGIYVLDLYGRRLVKRVQHLFDGTLVLISDNANYQRETIPRDKARDVRVIGRMVWPRV